MKFKPEYNLDVKRTNRKKTIALEVRDNGVKITVPYNLSIEEIEKILEKKNNWINNKLLFQKRKPKYKAKLFLDGEKFLFLGVEYKLKIVYSKTYNVYRENNFICIQRKKNGASSRKILENFYRQEAKIIFKNKVKHFEKILNLKSSNIKLRAYMRRWGSCNTQGELAFNWRLIMAPEKVINYVIVHELCHIVHYNHSKKFWKLVRYHYPSYKDQVNWLNKYSNCLLW